MAGELNSSPLAVGVLPLPASPNLEKALGYNPEFESEWVSFYYAPGCSIVDDGRVSYSGFDWNYVAFERLMRDNLYFIIGSYNFGTDDGPPNQYRFVLHRPSRRLHVLTENEAIPLLHKQWQEKPDHVAELYHKLCQEKEITNAQELAQAAIQHLISRPIDFLGTNPQIRELRAEMMSWYNEYLTTLIAGLNQPPEGEERGIN